MVAELADVPEEPQKVVPPWRPPGWEGTGAGMVPALPGESRPSALGRWMQSLQEIKETVSGFGRHPLLSVQQLRKQTGESLDAMVKMVVPGEVDKDQTLSGVPGALESTSTTTPPEPAPVKLGTIRESLLEAAAAVPVVRPEPVAEAQAVAEVAAVVDAEAIIEAEVAAADADAVTDAAAEAAAVADADAEAVADALPASEPPPTPRVLTGATHHLEVGPPAPPPPLEVPESPWQNRPDAGNPIDVLLGTLPPWGYNNPPVGLAHLATYARSKGYGVDVLDMNIDLYLRMGPEWQLLWHVENKNYWSNVTTFGLLMDAIEPYLETYANLIAEHPAPLVGLSVVDPKERVTIELIRRVKQRAPHKRVLLGGPACVTPEYRQIFIDNIPELVDGYAMGEGEQILCEAIERVRAGQDLADLPGVFCHRDGQDQPYRKRRRLEPLDHVPFPLYEDFLVERYPGDELIVEWSRGCIGSCTFCKGKMIDGKFRIHSARAIYEALRHYAEWLGIRKFTIADPVINGDVEVMTTLCRLINDSGLELLWRGEAIPHAGLTRELLNSMRAAGCMELQLGVESASDTVLAAMGKGRLFSAADAAQVVRETHEAGIRTALFIIIGFPGEGEEEFMETYEFVRANAAYIDELKSINALHIITDTPIHMKPDKYGLCLPEVDYHYKWSTADGLNTLEVRNDRIRRLKALAEENDIFVRETNLAEGKHHSLEQALAEEGRDRSELIGLLQQQITSIESV